MYVLLIHPLTTNTYCLVLLFKKGPFCKRKVDNWLPLLTLVFLHQYRRRSERRLTRKYDSNRNNFISSTFVWAFPSLHTTILYAMHFYKTYFVRLIYHSSCAAACCTTTILLSYDSGLQFFSTIALEVLCHSNNRLRCNWRTRVFLQQCRRLLATTRTIVQLLKYTACYIFFCSICIHYFSCA